MYRNPILRAATPTFREGQSIRTNIFAQVLCACFGDGRCSVLAGVEQGWGWEGCACAEQPNQKDMCNSPPQMHHLIPQSKLPSCWV